MIYKSTIRLFLLVAILTMGGNWQLSAQETEEPTAPSDEVPEGETDESKSADKMTVDKLNKIIMRIDEKAERTGNAWQFTVAERRVILVSDPNADRMRAMVPIAEAGVLTPELSERMLQANHDSALDARYTVAQNVIWSVFIHPLGPLDEPQLLNGIAQTVTAAVTFGTTFSSGATVYGGGDSNGILREQILEQLKKKDGTPV